MAIGWTWTFARRAWSAAFLVCWVGAGLPCSGEALPEPDKGAPGPPPTILSTALAVARSAGVSQMAREQNLTWQGGQLRLLTRLLCRAGKFDEALKLIADLDTPDRVKVEAFVPIVEAAMRGGDEARAHAVTQRIEAFREWTVAVALGEIAVARHKAGNSAEALRVAKKIDEPAARAEAFFALGRYDDMLLAARQIEPVSMHMPSDEGSFWENEYDARQAVLVRLVAAFVDHGDLRKARAAMDALAAVPDRGANLFRAQALLELARKDRPVANLKAAEKEIAAAPRERLGDLQGAADLLSRIAERFEALGQHSAAAAAVQKAVELGLPEAGDVTKVGTEIVCETMVRIARAERAIGQRPQALAMLERALRAVGAMPISHPEPAGTESGTDWNSMDRHSQVEAKLRVAAELEAAGEGKRAEEVLVATLAELRSIPSAEWRGYAWRSLVKAYRVAGRFDRGVDLLIADRSVNPDKQMAVTELSSAEILAGSPDRRWNLLAVLPASSEKASLASRLAVELDARGAREEAARMVAMSLGIIAAKPPQWVLALEFLGGEASGTDQPGDEAQQKLLAALLDITSEPR
jgi:tetratricopeptide (TPR) repeat protein